MTNDSLVFGLMGVERKSLPPVARNVRAYRAKLGLTQEALAKLAGLSSVAMIETGERENPRSLKALAKALRCSVSDLYRE